LKFYFLKSKSKLIICLTTTVYQTSICLSIIGKITGANKTATDVRKVMGNKFLAILMGLGLLMIILVACVGGNSGPAETIEAYNKALAAKDTNRVATLSCADWEQNAMTEVESLAAVSVDLENMQCSQSGVEGETTLVSCSGKIVANYGNEILEIDLSDRTYQAVQQGGQWLMCGYR
jgi:hypothetical protein